MVQMQTNMEVADNSGAKRITVITVLGQRKSIAHVGDIVTAAVNEAIPGGNVKKGDVVKAVIVRSVKGVKRADGTCVRFDENAAAVANAALDLAVKPQTAVSHLDLTPEA